MNFNKAKSVLRSLGYSVRRASGSAPGVVEYNVTLIEVGPDGGVRPLRWRMTADSIKAGVFRAMSLSGDAIQTVTVTDITT